MESQIQYIKKIQVTSIQKIRSLNEFHKINLNEMRRKSAQDDEVFNDCQYSDHEFD